jgi:AcrR family transcriptional regulator
VRSGYLSPNMVDTPWGKASELREQRLRPGPGRRRKEVVISQRHRLFAAMVASTTSKGYPETTVADLITLAGVSRATFYAHFEDKAACFRAAVEELFADGLGLLQSKLNGKEAPAEGGRMALTRLLQLVAAQPAAARMAFVDAYSAGPAGLEPINAAFEEACELAHRTLVRLPGLEETSEQLSRAVVGGLHRLLYIHLYRGEEQDLLDNCAVLWDWATGYPAPGKLPRQRRRRGHWEAPPPHPGRDQHERILRGFAAAVAKHGFSAVGIPQVAAEAGISNATFYKHFENKLDALLAALDLSGAQLVAATVPVARREADWPDALRRGIEGICGYLTSEPAVAKLRTVEVYSAGPDALMHRDRAWKQILAELIPPEVGGLGGPNELAIEASSGAVYALLYERVRRDELEKLRDLSPLLTYIMLAPLIGVEEATKVAAGQRREQLRPV